MLYLTLTKELVKKHYRLCSTIALANYYVYQGLILYRRKKYDDAFDSLRKALSFKLPQFEYRIIVYMNYVNRMKAIGNIDALYVESKGTDTPRGMKEKFLYFKMKNEGASLKTLENYLLSDVLNGLDCYNSLDVEVFTGELRECIKETKDYKTLTIWNDRLALKGGMIDYEGVT